MGFIASTAILGQSSVPEDAAHLQLMKMKSKNIYWYITPKSV